MFNPSYLDKFIKTPFLQWRFLISIGLPIELAERYHNEKKYKKIRTYFSSSNVTNYEEFIIFLIIEKQFNVEKAKELGALAFSTDYVFFELFFDEFSNIISVKNTSLDYYVLRGWSLAEAKQKSKLFFQQGAKHTGEKRKKNPLYDEWYKESRKNGANVSHTKQLELKQSKFELDLKKVIENSSFSNKKFFSPCIHPELTQIYNKKNFIHDFFINNQYIIEYNGSYWHKDYVRFPEKFSKDDYMFEIKKAFNCLNLVDRKLSYIIIWENDFSTPEEAFNFIVKCVNDKTSVFFSSRETDIILYNEYIINQYKQLKKHALFKDIVNRFSQESHCESKKVAALAVKNGRIIATGINGTPEGLPNCNDYFIQVHKEENIQIPYNEWILTKEWRELHHSWSNDNEVHAEQSLICEASKNGISLTNVDIYVSLEPCIHCSKLLAALKPNNIFYVNSYDKSSFKSKNLLNNLGIIITQI